MRLSESCTQRRRPQSCQTIKERLSCKFIEHRDKNHVLWLFLCHVCFQPGQFTGQTPTACPGREDKSILSFLKAVYIVNMNEQIINFQVKENNKKKITERMGFEL